MNANTPKAYSIAEFCKIYGIGKTSAYQEIKDGKLLSSKMGRRTLISAKSAEAWFQSLPTSPTKTTN